MKTFTLILITLGLCIVYTPSMIGQKSINTTITTLNSDDAKPTRLLPENIQRQQPTEAQRAILNTFEFSTTLKATEENMQALALYIRHGELRPSRLTNAKKTMARIKFELGLITSEDLAKYN